MLKSLFQSEVRSSVEDILQSVTRRKRKATVPSDEEYLKEEEEQIKNIGSGKKRIKRENIENESKDNVLAWQRGGLGLTVKERVQCHTNKGVLGGTHEIKGPITNRKDMHLLEDSSLPLDSIHREDEVSEDSSPEEGLFLHKEVKGPLFATYCTAVVLPASFGLATQLFGEHSFLA
ncbi:hypothetical protein NDU88_001824 [Pleurodeles waltl]|uniref:Uncharacterized protein n=1 Tax=Pleurodeles waltl TaxID=8319 RepID=A0AAV7VXL3_PLEWA|nr:hypothetical protein NDU88_001824 [Pleurodeles waltl]